jgi:MFS family permease
VRQLPPNSLGDLRMEERSSLRTASGCSAFDAAGSTGPLIGEGTHSVGLYAWYVTLVLALAQLIANLDRYLMSVVLEPIKTDLALSDSQLGLLTGTSFAVVFCIASIPLGRLADIANRRIIILCGILAWSAATFACGYATSFDGLFAARLGVGLGEAALVPAAVSIIATYFTRDTVAKGLAVFSTGSSLGRAAAFLGGGSLFGFLVARDGLDLFELQHFRPWQGVMLAAGLLGVAVAMICLTIREPVRRPVAIGRRTMKCSAIYFWHHRSVYLRLFLLWALIVGCATALATWTISLYARNYGMEVGKASLIVGTISLIAGPIASLCGGWLTDQLGKRKVAGAGLLVGAGALGLAPFAGLSFWLLHGLPYAVATYASLYFALAVAGPGCLSSVQAATPDRHRGLISSLYLCSYSLIGFGLAPLIVGIFNDYLFRSREAINLSLALLFFLFAVIGAPFALSGRHAYERMVERVDLFE